MSAFRARTNARDSAARVACPTIICEGYLDSILRDDGFERSCHALSDLPRARVWFPRPAGKPTLVIIPNRMKSALPETAPEFFADRVPASPVQAWSHRSVQNNRARVGRNSRLRLLEQDGLPIRWGRRCRDLPAEYRADAVEHLLQAEALVEIAHFDRVARGGGAGRLLGLLVVGGVSVWFMIRRIDTRYQEV